MPDKVFYTSSMENVSAAELNTGFRAEFTSVTNVTEVIFGGQRRHSLLHCDTFRLKTGQASLISGYASTIVMALFMNYLTWIDFCDRLRLGQLLLLVVEYSAD